MAEPSQQALRASTAGKDHRRRQPIEEGHKSVAMLHLGNIAWRVGREPHCNPADGHIKNDADAMKLWRREYEKGWEPKV